jgi:hypothetical protein
LAQQPDGEIEQAKHHEKYETDPKEGSKFEDCQCQGCQECESGQPRQGNERTLIRVRKRAFQGKPSDFGGKPENQGNQPLAKSLLHPIFYQ